MVDLYHFKPKAVFKNHVSSLNCFRTDCNKIIYLDSINYKTN